MTSSSSRPLSSHPAFPVVVALWFAALLGGGTFVLPASVFESVAGATGLAEIVPAAQPPLGDTARLAISIAAAILGALIGLFIAWQVRRASRQGQEAASSEGATSATIRNEDTAPIEQGQDDDASAWEVWREQMTEDSNQGDDRDDEADPYDPADALVRDPILDDDGAFLADSGDDLDRVDAARDGGTRDEPDYDPASDTAAPGYPTTDADDPQRAEADRLVAGLARMRREDGADRTRMDETPSIDPVAQSDDAPDEPLSFRDESEDASIFDSSFVSAAPGMPSEDRDGDLDDLPAREPEPESKPRSESDETSAPSEPLKSLSLPELVARLELALEARARGDATSASGDAVVAFLRREAERGDAAQDDEAPANADDPQAMLRAALDKLDQVGRKP